MTNAKALLLAILIVAGMIVSPVCALGYEVVSISDVVRYGGTIETVERVSNLSVDLLPAGNALQQLEVDLGSGTSVNFTLWYGNGETVSGWMEYRNSTDCWGWFSGDLCQYSGVSIGTDVQGSSSRALQEIGRIDIAAYGRNWTSDTEYTTGFLVFDTMWGLQEGNRAYFPVANGTNNIIYKFEFVSTNPVTVTYLYNSRDKIVSGIAGGNPIKIINEWIALAGKYAGSAVDFIAGIFWILKFFFVDNILLVVALWISVSMAYSAISSKNIFAFYTKFFRLQKALLDFVVSLWMTLWGIVNYLVQIFVKWL